MPAVFGWVSQVPPVLPVAAAPGVGVVGVGVVGETSCFYDPTRKAAKNCSNCGVFISDAWSAQWGGQEVCLSCLDDLRNKGVDIRYQTKRNLWDNIVLALAIGPWLVGVAFLFTGLFYFVAAFAILLTLVTAPAALFVGLRYWNAPRSLAPRGRGRLLTGVILAGVQLAVWIVGIIAVVNNWGDFGW